ncbi:hypothetical protein BT69DRAFT_1287903 [Atractiella rhizophila]|nr:hypothetical protein BT69DRAFT_1287903 [Atractiella rhizophila]
MLEDQGKSYDVNGDMADDTSLLPSNLTSFNWHGLPVELRIIVVSFLASSSKPRILDLISFSVCDRETRAMVSPFIFHTLDISRPRCFPKGKTEPKSFDYFPEPFRKRIEHIKFHIDIDSSLVESCSCPRRVSGPGHAKNVLQYCAQLVERIKYMDMALEKISIGLRDLIQCECNFGEKVNEFSVFSTFYDLLLARREDIVLDFRVSFYESKFFHSIPSYPPINCVVALCIGLTSLPPLPLPFPHLSFLALSNESRDGFHSFVSLDRCLRINGKGLRRLHIYGPINVDPDDYDETMEEAEFVRHYEALDAPSLLPQLEELELINPFPFDPKMETARILSYFSLSPVNAFIWEQSRFASYGIMVDPRFESYYDMAMYFFDKILDQRRRGRWKTLHVVALGKNICRELVVTENPLTKLGDMIKETKIKLMGYRELQVRLLMEHNQ